MPNAPRSPKTPGRFPYRAGKPARSRRVVKAKDADAPRGVRRKEQPQPALHVSPMQARGVLAAAMIACLLAAAWWAYHSPYLTVAEPEITGASRLTPQQIHDAAAVTGDSVFGLDLDAAEARVAALPEVRSAEVTKHGWSGVTISVEERTPWGSWQIDGVNVPIDIDGYVMAGEAAPADAPIILEVEPQRVLNGGDRVDPGAVALAARLIDEADTAFGRRVMALIYRRQAGLTAVLSAPDIDGKPLWVTFGDNRDYDYKIATLYVLLEQAKEEKLALSAVDLRFGDRLSFN